ncbi:sensor histidine kinase [Edaphobacter dinghuensis]|uniref:sensor histidine kinase n=1 Tax=Edaphobacter dinghuensis TaxID=1560005 RepID=UPI0016652328|nr:histidine kinase [Edaphobacter dinghuensis]
MNAPDLSLAMPSNDAITTPFSGNSTDMEVDAGLLTGLRLNGHAVIFSAATFLGLTTAAECHSITYLPSLLYGAVLWLWWGCIASGMWKLSTRLPFASNFSLKTISIQLFAGSALGIVHLLLLGSVGFTNSAWRAHASALSIWTSLLNINRFGIEVLLYGFLFGIIGIVQFQIRAQQDALKSMELRKQLSAAHLRALQMQLEPHFLFNTLNAITTLVEFGRQKEALATLSHLNAMLRSTLQRTTPEKVPLSQELEMMENYLAIEQVRFADRLRIEIKVEPGALDGLVPCFLLQPIVENAIRHGIANCESEGVVEASARRDGAILLLRVRDSGSGLRMSPQNGHGIGLNNTRDRLAHFYRDGYSMKAQPVESGGFEVAISIPYERCLR